MDTSNRWAARIVLAAVIVAITIAVFVIARGIIAMRDRFTQAKTVPIKSPVDGMTYEVHDSYPNPAEAADTLAQINQKVIGIMRYLKNKYVKDASPEIAAQYPERVKAVRRLLARYNPDNLAENSPFDPEGDTSYTLDKGALMALCLRDRKPRPGKTAMAEYEDGAIHPLDVLLFVTVHEMAHVAIDDLDHPPKFWAAFKFLLEEVEDSGIAAFPDYRAEPVGYCGIKIDWNPLYDANTIAIQ